MATTKLATVAMMARVRAPSVALRVSSQKIPDRGKDHEQHDRTEGAGGRDEHQDREDADGAQ
ncbi:MAG TPA: hypothetical protein VGL46_14025 [Pseudonocardiaceae bacterium]|jgi:hypothetical protein